MQPFRVRRFFITSVLLGTTCVAALTLAFAGNAGATPVAGSASVIASASPQVPYAPTSTASASSTAASTTVPQPSLIANPLTNWNCGGGCTSGTVTARLNTSFGNLFQGVVESIAGFGGALGGAGGGIACASALFDDPFGIIHCVLAGGSIAVAGVAVLGDGLYNLFGSL